MADIVIYWILFVSLLFVEVKTDSGELFISSSNPDKHPCEFDVSKCQHGICRQTEKVNDRNFLCACPPERTGTLCEKTTDECSKCKPKARTECIGLRDGKAVCICLEYEDSKINAPSICYFNKAKPDRQKACIRGDHNCTRGQECVNYAEQVCQCPVGNTRGRDCEQDYKFDIPGDVYSCIDTNMVGPICMCKKYGNNKEDGYGFCKPNFVKPKLISPLSDDGPCSYDKNKCRHGVCFLTDTDKFVCGCHGIYYGKYCHHYTPLCEMCSRFALGDCVGLGDGSAVCACSKFSSHYKKPSLCRFRKPKSSRQNVCKGGDYNCEPGEQCVNYVYFKGNYDHIVCQCPVGNTRGKNCIEDYKFTYVANEQEDCFYSEKYGPFCLCYEYDFTGQTAGFCKPKIKVHGAVVKPKGSGGPCDIRENKCRRGVCMETETSKDWNFLCACPKYNTGRLCHLDMIECTKCKESARTDCIGLLDGTAVCICLEVQDNIYVIAPVICYYKEAKSNNQDACRRGEHDCTLGQECVNYAQQVCQCPVSGNTRGSDCEQDYKFDNPGDVYSCIDTNMYYPICMCNKYGNNKDDGYGFCKPNLVKPKFKTPLSDDGPCSKRNNKCRNGVCVLTAKDKFFCGCHSNYYGKFCQYPNAPFCSSCKRFELGECLGLEDGTAVCTCNKFYSRFRKPSLCYYQKAKSSRQKACKDGKYNCKPGKQCVNYAQDKDQTLIVCQCPIGRTRGKNCKEDYKFKDIANKKEDCFYSEKYGPFCLCKTGGRAGFCKPKIKVHGTVVKRHIKGSDLPCDVSNNICREGTCVELRDKNETKFVCSCPFKKAGRLCAQDMHECTMCRNSARKDCIGLPDGTAVCICVEFMKRNLAEEPAICYFQKAKTHRQKACKVGNHKCYRGQECVNYAQNENEMQMTCQCPSGNYRGRNCNEEYKRIRTSDVSCIDTQNVGPICMCEEYGHGINKFGFCKPNLQKSYTNQGEKSSKGNAEGKVEARRELKREVEKISHSCDVGENKCGLGVCMETEAYEDMNFLCACPQYTTGERCEQDMIECTKCKESARTDCIGLPDGTAVCICLEVLEMKYGTPPLICYYKKAKPYKQKACRAGNHNCDPSQQCVNYAQSENRTQMTCQCPAENKRGSNCNEDYLISRTTEYPCISTKGFGPICLCGEYGHGSNKFGFCKPNLQKDSKSQGLTKHKRDVKRSSKRFARKKLVRKKFAKKKIARKKFARKKFTRKKLVRKKFAKKTIARKKFARKKFAKKKIARKKFARKNVGRTKLSRKKLTRKKTTRKSFARKINTRKKLARKRFGKKKVGTKKLGRKKFARKTIHRTKFGKKKFGKTKIAKKKFGRKKVGRNKLARKKFARKFSKKEVGRKKLARQNISRKKFGKKLGRKKLGRKKFGRKKLTRKKISRKKFGKKKIAKKKVDGKNVGTNELVREMLARKKFGRKKAVRKKFGKKKIAKKKVDGKNVGTNELVREMLARKKFGRKKAVRKKFGKKKIAKKKVDGKNVGTNELVREMLARKRFGRKKVVRKKFGKKKIAKKKVDGKNVGTKKLVREMLARKKFGRKKVVRKKFGKKKIAKKKVDGKNVGTKKLAREILARKKFGRKKVAKKKLDGKKVGRKKIARKKLKSSRKVYKKKMPDEVRKKLLKLMADRKSNKKEFEQKFIQTYGEKKYGKYKSDRKKAYKMKKKIALKKKAMNKRKWMLTSEWCSGACKRGGGLCKDFGKRGAFVCACNLGKRGQKCELKSYPCSSCEKDARLECIGLPDETARCICTKFIDQNITDVPAICYFKRSKEQSLQKCESGKHSCGTSQECVNYARDKNETQMTCQCAVSLHGKRGANCEESYKNVIPDGKSSCVLAGGYPPICLCNKYGSRPGFCKAKLSRGGGEVTESPIKSVETINAFNNISSKKGQGETSLHLLDPEENPCSSRPCLHDGICEKHLSTPTQDFICVCPLGRKGKVCDISIPNCDSLACTKKTDCVSTPEGAICICTINYQEQMCSIKMRDVTDWEKVKLVITARTIQKLEIVAIILLVLLGLTLLYLIRHCIRVSSERQAYAEKYEKVIKKGDVPVAPLPDWLDVSNDLAGQTFCCRASKLPQSFNPKKKKKGNKKDRKKKKYKGVNDEEMKEKDQNENFPVSKRKFLFNSESNRTEVLQRNSMLKHYGPIAKTKVDNRKSKIQLRQDNVKEYINKHKKYFANISNSRNPVKTKHDKHVQSTQGIFSVKKRTELGTSRRSSDDTFLRLRMQRDNHKHPRSKSSHR